MRVIGLDPGLANLGLVCLDGGEREPLTHCHLDLAALRGVERLQRLYRWPLDWPAADLVVVEGYAFDRANQAHQIGEGRGALLLGMANRGYRVIELAPSALKQWLSGKGNLAPQLMPMRVLALWGWEAPSEHEAAAYALARFGEAVLEVEEEAALGGETAAEWIARGLLCFPRAGRPKLPAYQQDVLARWFSPPVKGKGKGKRQAAKAGR